MITEEDANPKNVIAINEDAAKHLEIVRKQTTDEKQFRKCIGLHKDVEVDVVARTVVCRTCGYTVDPFDYLELWSREGERRMTGLKALDVKLRVRSAEVRDLDRKIANLRATLKRLGGKSMDEHLEFMTAEINPRSERYQEWLRKKEEAS
jgi:hypothetical protein